MGLTSVAWFRNQKKVSFNWLKIWQHVKIVELKKYHIEKLKKKKINKKSLKKVDCYNISGFWKYKQSGNI